jgi:hypothetical protein
VLIGALQKNAAKAISVLDETDSTLSAPAPVLLSGKARLETAVVATMKLRSEVASMLHRKSEHALALLNDFE